MTTKETAKKIAIATAKGVVSGVPYIGGLLAEYMGLVTDKMAAKIMNEWMKLVDDRLSKIECKIEELADDEFFYSCVHATTQGAIKAPISEKREMYANALYNSFAIKDISEEKKSIFIWQLEKYNLVSIKVLNLLSQNNILKSSHRLAGSASFGRNNYQDFIEYIVENIPELENEDEFLKLIINTLYTDGMIELIDFQYLERGARCAGKRTTLLGDQFIKFIKLNE